MDRSSPLTPAASGLQRAPASSALERTRAGYLLTCKPDPVGLGSWLVESIIEDLSLFAEPRFVLATKDAHDVYRRRGFTALEGSDRWMVLDRRPTPPAVG